MTLLESTNFFIFPNNNILSSIYPKNTRIFSIMTCFIHMVSVSALSLLYSADIYEEKNMLTLLINDITFVGIIMNGVFQSEVVPESEVS